MKYKQNQKYKILISFTWKINDYTLILPKDVEFEILRIYFLDNGNFAVINSSNLFHKYPELLFVESIEKYYNTGKDFVLTLEAIEKCCIEIENE